MELEEGLRWALEARGLVAAARDPERLRAELEAARLLRAGDAFELLRAEPAFELLRAAEFELLRAAEFELLRAAEFEFLRAEPELELRRLELAAVVPLALAAGRLSSPAFGEALCFVLVCLATSCPLYGTKNTPMQHRLPRPAGLSLRRSSCGCRVALRTALRVRGDPPRSPGRAGAPHSLRRPAEP